MKYGVKSVTMDDVAKNLRMSKKTLYQYVSDKKDLVKKVMEFGKNMDETAVTMICSGDGNAIDQNYEISKFVLSKVKNIHPSVFFDLEKYYPEAWEVMEGHKEDFIYGCILDNIKLGMKEGLYREDLHPELTALTYVHAIDMIFHMFAEHPEVKMSFEDMYLQSFRYHIRGIASEKGREYLKDKIKKEHY